MDNLRKQTALNIAIKSILFCSAISHSAFAQEQKSNEADASVLPTITVKADAQDEKTEGSGSFKAKSSRSSSKLNLSLKETPQSVSVVTREQIEQRGLTILDDVLAATPGVTATKNDSERSNYYSRGFQITNRQIDGMPVGDNAPRFDSFSLTELK